MPRRLVVVLLVLVLIGSGVGLAAVLLRGDDDAANPEDGRAVATAAEATLDAGTAHLTVHTEGSARGEAIEVDGQGLLDLVGRRAQVTIVLPAALQSRHVDAVVDGAVIYLQVPPEAGGAIGVSTPWASIDVERLRGTPVGAVLAGIPGTGTADPAQALELLRGVQRAEAVGEESVGDATTTHYRVPLDAADAASRAGDVHDQARFTVFVDGIGNRRTDVDVWVDGDGLVRRIRYPQAVGAESPATLTVDLSDFGVAETVGVPPPDQVTDVTDLAPAFAAAG